MRRLILALLVSGLATAGTTALTGCPARTDCKKMKQQMDKCSVQLWSRLEPHRGRSSGRFGQAKNVQHFQYCKKHKGRYKQSAEINRCLRHDNCNKFARCFCRAVKKNKKSCR
jgi:multimeric flavodoxin WrbA